MDQETFDQVYGGAIRNVKSQEDIEEQEARIENGKTELKLKQQQHQQQIEQQQFNQKMMIGGLSVAGVLVLAILLFAISKIRKHR